MEKKLEKILYLFIAFVVLSFVSSFLFKQYVKKYGIVDDSPIILISNDKLYRAEIIITDKLAFINWINSFIPTGIGGGSPPPYEFVRLYNNKTGEFIGESNLCTTIDGNTIFPSDIQGNYFMYGQGTDNYSFFYPAESCEIRY